MDLVHADTIAPASSDDHGPRSLGESVSLWSCTTPDQSEGLFLTVLAATSSTSLKMFSEDISISAFFMKLNMYASGFFTVECDVNSRTLCLILYIHHLACN